VYCPYTVYFGLDLRAVTTRNIIVMYEGFSWLILTGSGLDDLIYWHFDYNCNQLRQLTISDCLRLTPVFTGLRVSSLPRDWLGSDLRVAHFFSFRCSPVSTPQLNMELLMTELQLTCDSLELNWTQSQSQSYIATDGRSINKPWCRAPSGAHDQIFITVWLLRSCFCGASSLTRGRVCHLYPLLVLASAVFLGSESIGSRNHILLSQFWDFPFRRLLRLAGSRWRYSIPPPHGWTPPPHGSVRFITSCEPNISHHVLPFYCYSLFLCLTVAAGTVAQQWIIPRLLVAAGAFLPNSSLAMVIFRLVVTETCVSEPLASNGLSKKHTSFILMTYE
jgi:hypothetical protein